MSQSARHRTVALAGAIVAIAAVTSGCSASSHAKSMTTPTPTHAMMSKSPSPHMMSPTPTHAMMEPTPSPHNSK